MALNESDGIPLWTQHFAGGFLSISLVSDEQAYVIIGVNQNDVALLALGARDGSHRWQFPKSGGVGEFSGDQIEEANGNVFLVTDDPTGTQAVSLKASDGSVRWQKPFQPGPADSWFIDQSSLYVSLHGTVVTLAANDGSLKWQRQISTQLAAIKAAGDGVAYSLSPNQDLVFFHTSDGSDLWSFPAPGQLDLRVEDIINGVVYVSGNDNGGHAGQDTFYALNAADGSVRWTYAVGGTFGVIIG